MLIIIYMGMYTHIHTKYELYGYVRAYICAFTHIYIRTEQNPEAVLCPPQLVHLSGPGAVCVD